MKHLFFMLALSLATLQGFSQAQDSTISIEAPSTSLADQLPGKWSQVKQTLKGKAVSASTFKGDYLELKPNGTYLLQQKSSKKPGSGSWKIEGNNLVMKSAKTSTIWKIDELSEWKETKGRSERWLQISNDKMKLSSRFKQSGQG